MQNKGFSLIELLVVITIIGLLSAIATGTYRHFTLRSKVAGAIALASSISQQAEVYAVKNGRFPNAAQLGYAVNNGLGAPTDTAIANTATTMSPYITYIAVSGDSCGKNAFTAVHLSPAALGGDLPSNVTTLVVAIWSFNINGTFKRWCVYAEGDGSSNWYSDDALFPGCYNEFVPNLTAYFAQYNAYLSAASCM